MPYEKILNVLVCGCQFRATDEDGKLFPADAEFNRMYKMGIRNFLTTVCGIDEKKDAAIFKNLGKLDKKPER